MACANPDDHDGVEHQDGPSSQPELFMNAAMMKSVDAGTVSGDRTVRSAACSEAEKRLHDLMASVPSGSAEQIS